MSWAAFTSSAVRGLALRQGIAGRFQHLIQAAPGLQAGRDAGERQGQVFIHAQPTARAPAHSGSCVGRQPSIPPSTSAGSPGTKKLQAKQTCQQTQAQAAQAELGHGERPASLGELAPERPGRQAVKGLLVQLRRFCLLQAPLRPRGQEGPAAG